MILCELFNRPAEFSIMAENKHLFKAAFHVGDRTIVFRCDGNRSDLWFVVFYQLGTGEVMHQMHDMTNDGGEFDVMSTVKKLMDVFIEKYKPGGIVFSADKSEDSRIKVYQRMVGRYLPPNYERKMNSDYEEPGFETFHLKRKDQ